CRPLLLAAQAEREGFQKHDYREALAGRLPGEETVSGEGETARTKLPLETYGALRFLSRGMRRPYSDFAKRRLRARVVPGLAAAPKGNAQKLPSMMRMHPSGNLACVGEPFAATIVVRCNLAIVGAASHCTRVARNDR